MQFEYFVWTQSGNRQQLQNAFWDVLAHAFKRGIASSRVDPLDDGSDGLTNAGDLLQPVVSDQLIEWNAEREQIIGSTCISLGAIRAAAAQCGALGELAQQPSNLGGINGHDNNKRS